MIVNIIIDCFLSISFFPFLLFHDYLSRIYPLNLLSTLLYNSHISYLLSYKKDFYPSKIWYDKSLLDFYWSIRSMLIPGIVIFPPIVDS